MKYQEVTQKLRNCRFSEDEEILKRADLIGLTTTGAAKYRNLIQNLSVSNFLQVDCWSLFQSQANQSQAVICRSRWKVIKNISTIKNSILQQLLY